MRPFSISLDAPEIAPGCVVRDERWILKQVSISGKIQCNSQRPYLFLIRPLKSDGINQTSPDFLTYLVKL
jgi:hypothetical protein